MSSTKIYYWGFPGKAEAVRLAFKVGEVAFEDVAVTGDSWKELKAEVIDHNPLVNLPLLEVNGNFFSESKAMLRYAGRVGKASLAGKTDLDTLKVDQSIDFTEDFYSAFGPTFSLPTNEEKIAARQALIAPEGKITTLLTKTEQYIKSFGPGAYVCGSYITIGDLALWSVLCLLVSAFLDGVPTTLFDSYPNIAAYKKMIGAHPKIADFYKNETEGIRFIGYKNA